MNADNQTWVILFLGSALLISIWTNRPEAIITGLTGALAGIFMGKNMNDKQSEFIDENLRNIITDTVKETVINDGGDDGSTGTRRHCGQSKE